MQQSDRLCFPKVRNQIILEVPEYILKEGKSLTYYTNPLPTLHCLGVQNYCGDDIRDNTNDKVVLQIVAFWPVTEEDNFCFIYITPEVFLRSTELLVSYKRNVILLS